MSAVEITIPESLIEAIAQRLEQTLAVQPSTTRWLTVRKAADHLGLSTNSIRALIKRDRIPYYKTEGRILLEQGELDKWVRNGGATP